MQFCRGVVIRLVKDIATPISTVKGRNSSIPDSIQLIVHANNNHNFVNFKQFSGNIDTIVRR